MAGLFHRLWPLREWELDQGNDNAESTQHLGIHWQRGYGRRSFRRPSWQQCGEPGGGHGLRPRLERFDVGVHFSLASGYSGQTLETLQLQGETGPTERIVGVRKASYAGITFTYHPRRVGQE